MKEVIEKVKVEEIICLYITSWAGLSIGAEHYYAKLKTYDYRDEKKEIELKRIITEVKEARYLSKKLGYKGILKVGDKTDCFTTEDQIIKEARLQYKKYFPETKVIILGDTGCWSPQKVILGPRNFKKLVNICYKEYEKIWEESRKKRISDNKIFKKLKPVEKRWQKIWPVK